MHHKDHHPDQVYAARNVMERFRLDGPSAVSSIMQPAQGDQPPLVEQINRAVHQAYQRTSDAREQDALRAADTAWERSLDRLVDAVLVQNSMAMVETLEDVSDCYHALYRAAHRPDDLPTPERMNSAVRVMIDHMEYGVAYSDRYVACRQQRTEAGTQKRTGFISWEQLIEDTRDGRRFPGVER